MNINEYAKAIETKVAEIAGEEMAVTLNEKILNNGGGRISDHSGQERQPHPSEYQYFTLR